MPDLVPAEAGHATHGAAMKFMFQASSAVATIWFVWFTDLPAGASGSAVTFVHATKALCLVLGIALIAIEILLVFERRRNMVLRAEAESRAARLAELATESVILDAIIDVLKADSTPEDVAAAHAVARSLTAGDGRGRS